MCVIMMQRGCIARECPSPVNTRLSSAQVPKLHRSLLPSVTFSPYPVSAFANGPAYTDRFESAVTAGQGRRQEFTIGGRGLEPMASA